MTYRDYLLGLRELRSQYDDGWLTSGELHSRCAQLREKYEASRDPSAPEGYANLPSQEVVRQKPL